MDSFTGRVVPYIPGCPEVVAEKSILEAAISLCKNTNCWRTTFEATIAAVEDTDETEEVETVLTFETGGVLVSIPKFTRDDRDSDNYTFTLSTITVPAWSNESDIEAILSQRPEITAEVLPTAFKAMTWTSWEDALIALSKSLLYSMPGVPWFNPQASGNELNKYNKECGRLRFEIQQPNPMTSMRVQPRPFV